MKFWSKKEPSEPEKATVPDHFFKALDIEFLVHELKGPLAIIESNIRTLLDRPETFGDLSLKQETVLKRSLRNSKKAREMVYSLLEIGRSEMACYHCLPFLPAEAVHEALMDCLEMTDAKLWEKLQSADKGPQSLDILRDNGILVTVARGVASMEIDQDQIKFKQIVGNLLRNALYYKRDSIAVNMDNQNGILIVEVADDGPGIPPKHHARVFERYTQVEKDETSKRSGHGLGLSGAYILAKRLGGDIDIVSQPGKGTRFILSFPLELQSKDQDNPNIERGDTMTGETSNLKGKHILAVDDEIDILETIEDVLDDSVMDLAETYDSALEKIRKNSYDLAILDIMGVNGLELLEETVKKGIPSVMLTAHAMSPDSLMESIRKGAISYLPKESLSELDSLLEDLLDAHLNGRPPWKLLFEKLGDFFDERFGAGWKAGDTKFWSDFSRNYQVSRGIQERLKSDPDILSKGI